MNIDRGRGYSPDFWHALMAAELSGAKGMAILAELAETGADPLSYFAGHAALSPGEKRRLEAHPQPNWSQTDAKLLTPDEYPEMLRESEAKFPALMFRGDSSCLEAPTVGIVGTRSASTYGKACAQKFAEALARAGVTVVSGGALGIDAAAHKGALAGGGKTAAVLANGVDHVYPSVHAGLFDQIRENGCLVSHYALGTKPADYRFIQRNELIASLSSAILVVEAPPKSGALSTAHSANDLGRDVFVVPGNIDQFGFFGSFGLIRDGATLVDHPNQVLEALGIEPGRLAPVQKLGGVAGEILAVLTVEPVPTEVIVEQTGLATDVVLTELTMMELDGTVIRDGRGYAKRP